MAGPIKHISKQEHLGRQVSKDKPTLLDKQAAAERTAKLAPAREWKRTKLGRRKADRQL